MPLHIIDGELNPDPMTVEGTKDLVAMFWALKKLPHPTPCYRYKGSAETAKNKKSSDA